jgi:hypothetical protein
MRSSLTSKNRNFGKVSFLTFREYEILYEDGICILKILKVLLEDEGEYSCEAVNVNGRAMTSCFFKVIG